MSNSGGGCNDACLICREAIVGSRLFLNIGHGIGRAVCDDCHNEFIAPNAAPTPQSIGPKRGAQGDDAQGGAASSSDAKRAVPRKKSAEKEAAKQARADARAAVKLVRGKDDKRRRANDLQDELARAILERERADAAHKAAKKAAKAASVEVARKAAELTVWRDAAERAERQAKKRETKRGTAAAAAPAAAAGPSPGFGVGPVAAGGGGGGDEDTDDDDDDEEDGDGHDPAKGPKNPANEWSVRAGRKPYVPYEPTYHSSKGRYQTVYDKIIADKTLFPASGLPTPLEGQWIVLLSRAYYRFYNDVDMFYVGPDAQLTGRVLKSLFDTGRILERLSSVVEAVPSADRDYGILEMLQFLRDGITKMADGRQVSLWGAGGWYSADRFEGPFRVDPEGDDDDDDEIDINDPGMDEHTRREIVARQIARSHKANYGEQWFLTDSGVLVNTGDTEQAVRWFAFVSKWTYNVFNMRAMDTLMDLAIEAAADRNAKIAAWMAEAGSPMAAAAPSSSAASAAAAAAASSSSSMTQKKLQFRLVSSPLAAGKK